MAPQAMGTIQATTGMVPTTTDMAAATGTDTITARQRITTPMGTTGTIPQAATRLPAMVAEGTHPTARVIIRVDPAIMSRLRQ